MKNFPEPYNGETGRWLIERVNGHSGKNINSHIFKHSIEDNHSTVTLDDFTALIRRYSKRKFKRKVSES